MLIFKDTLLSQMKEHGLSGYPDEVCGLLIGSVDQTDRSRRVHGVRRARNLNQERSRDRYDLDPIDYQRVEEEAQGAGLAVLGVYHSHPDHPSRPSETDRQRAHEIWDRMESWSYVILEVTREAVRSLRSWVLREGLFHEEEIRLE